MKWIFAILASYLAVTFYFTVLNFSAFAWFPVALVLMLIFYFNASPALTATVAVTAGAVTDLHFLYMGPTVLAYVLIFFSLRFLQKFVPSNTIGAAIALVAFASAEFFFLQTIGGVLMHGVQRTVPAMASLAALFLFAAVSSVVASLAQTIVATIRKSISHER